MKKLTSKFLSKMRKLTNGCWEWTACCYHDGYAAFGVGGKMVRAHRFAYEQIVGPIPEGLVTDHLCRNRKCVNPDHIEPVTNRENLIRGIGPAVQRIRHASKTHCVNGHILSHRNSQRYCRVCNRDRMRNKRTADRIERGVEGTAKA